MKLKKVARWVSVICASLATTAIAQTATPWQQPDATAPAPAQADTPAGGADLLQTVAQSVESHPEVQARYHDFLSSLEDQSIARAGWRPQATVQGWIGKEWRTHLPDDGASYDWNRPGWSLTLRQMLWDGLATSNSVKQLGYEKLSKYYDLVATTDSLANDVVGAWLDVQRYRETERLARDNYTVHQTTLRLLQERSQSGVGRGVDLEQASGRLSLAQANVMTESNNLNAVSERYRRVVGAMPPQFLGPVPDAGAKMPSPSEAQSFSGPIRQNPTMLSKQALVQAADKGILVAKAAYSPRLDLLASTGRDRTEPYAPYYDLQSTSVQLQLTYPLYRGGADRARVRQTTAQSYAAVDVRDYTCRNVLQDMSIAWNNIVMLREQIPYLREHELSTAKVRQAFQQQFQIGERTLLDLLNTENELFDARRALVNAQFDLQKNEYQWLMLSGRIMEALGVPDPHNSDRPAEDAQLSEDALRNCMNAAAPDTSNLSPIPAAQYTPAPATASRAPLMTEKPVVIDGTNFAFGSALLPEANGRLNEVLKAATDYPDITLQVDGHTDNVGALAVNQSLSERRAEAVKAWLVSHGVAAHRIVTAGHADTQPVADNATAEGRAANRRVEVRYIVRQTQTQ